MEIKQNMQYTLILTHYTNRHTEILFTDSFKLCKYYKRKRCAKERKGVLYWRLFKLYLQDIDLQIHFPFLNVLCKPKLVSPTLTDCLSSASFN